MGPAVYIERRALGIMAEPHRPVLVGHAGQRNPLANEEIAGEQSLVAVAAVNGTGALLLHEAFQFGNEPLVPLAVVRSICQDDSAVPVERDPIVRVGQVFRGEPKIQRVLAHQIESPSRCNRGRPG